MIYTSYYGNIKKLKKAKIKSVAISASIPTYLPHVDSIKIIAPPYELLGVDNIFVYRKTYIAYLEQIGLDKIQWELNKRDGNIALLCYESIGDITSGKKFCHRRIFAAWYESKAGVAIPEYDTVAIEEEKAQRFPTLQFIEN